MAWYLLQADGGGDGGGYGGWWPLGWWWVFWIFIIALFIILVGWGGTTWFRGRRGTHDDILPPSPASPLPPGDASLTPEEILKRRYARGEIDKEEFDRKLRELRG